MPRQGEAAGRWERHGGTKRSAEANSQLQRQYSKARATAQGQGPPIRAANGRVIGGVCGGVFRKRLYRSRHFLRVPRAICFDEQSLREAERRGAHRVEVEEMEESRLYRASIASIWRLGFPVRRGHGQQVGLGLEHWEVSGDGMPAQLSFFGGAA